MNKPENNERKRELQNIKTVLFDLDDTLLDRATTFSRYCDHLISTLFPAGMSNTEKNKKKEFLILHDKSGYENKEVFYQKVIQHWNLSCTVAHLVQKWSDSFTKFSMPVKDLLEILEYLSSKYTLGIVTNGSTSMQNRKIDALGIRPFFQAIIVSGAVGIKKPDKGIFLLACKSLNTDASEAVFIGDNYENDFIGAKQAGLQAIWLNQFLTDDDSQYTIKNLASLRYLL